MARLSCADCGAAVGKADPVCWSCGLSLLEDGATVEAAPVAAPAPASGGDPAGPATVASDLPGGAPPAASASSPPAGRCPACGADIPDPRHLVCLQCMTELDPSAAPAGTPAARAGANGVDPYATHREPRGAMLTVAFDFGDVELSVGDEVLLGRDASDHRLASLHDKNNVSRRHATIGLTPRGAWVRDEESTNGTYVDGRRVAAGQDAELAEGAELRLASDVRATVRLNNLGKPGHE